MSFDLVVIGGGPGGYVAAIRASQLGLHVALVEKRNTLGGTCLNVGCVPSKALLESSAMFHHLVKRAATHGVMLNEPQFDLDVMMARKSRVVEGGTQGLDLLMKKNKIQVFYGHGKVLSNSKVEVDGQELESKAVLLATGSIPVELPFMPFDGEKVISSTEALSLQAVPDHLVVVGAGVIGLELGSVWNRLGAKVTVLELANSILPGIDGTVSKTLEKSLRAQGLDIKLGVKVSGLVIDPAFGVTLDDGSVVECSKVLVAVGRRPYSSGLGLEELGIATERGRVIINSNFETSVKGIYAIGDLVAGPMLAHKAEEEGVAVAQILSGLQAHVDYNIIPGVVYTEPELATVGISQEEAKARKIKVKVGRSYFQVNARARAMDSTEGMVKVIADEVSGKILGIHMVGPMVSELIAEAVAVMRTGTTWDELGYMVHAHPTLSEVLKEAALSTNKVGIH